jgi:hypothetical protein
MPGPLFVPMNFGCSCSETRIPDVAKVVSLTFQTDHAKLNDNDKDWLKTGTKFPEPEFKYGKKSHPISHTRKEKVRVKIEIELYPIDLPSRDYKVRGKATWGNLDFELDAPLKGGKQELTLTSTQELPDKVVKLSGDINWGIEASWLPSMPADHSWGHVIYVSHGVPNDSASVTESGITLKRMENAIKWIAAANSLDPHVIVDSLMGHFPGYTLESSPKVPKAFDHPGFLTQPTDKGGAWPMVDYESESGECQAIVRLVRANLWQAGVPGAAKVMVVWAEPASNPQKHEVKEDDWEAHPFAGLNTSRVVKGKTQQAVLIDDAVQVGKTYPPSHSALPGGGSSPGANRYEACLWFQQGGKTVYYGGGAGKYANKDEVITAFWGLIWVEFLPDMSYKVVEIVKRWH